MGADSGGRGGRGGLGKDGLGEQQEKVPSRQSPTASKETIISAGRNLTKQACPKAPVGRGRGQESRLAAQRIGAQSENSYLLDGHTVGRGQQNDLPQKGRTGQEENEEGVEGGRRERGHESEENGLAERRVGGTIEKATYQLDTIGGQQQTDLPHKDSTEREGNMGGGREQYESEDSGLAAR